MANGSGEPHILSNWTSTLGPRPWVTSNNPPGGEVPRQTNQPTILSSTAPVYVPPPTAYTTTPAPISVIADLGASVPTQVSVNPLLVRAAQLQNISVNAVTLGTVGTITPGNGFILNGAAGVGNAGDTVTIAPQGDAEYIDLASIWFVQIGTGNTLALWVFQ